MPHLATDRISRGLRWAGTGLLLAGVLLIVAGIGWTQSADALIMASAVAVLAFGLPGAAAFGLAFWLEHTADRLEHVAPPTRRRCRTTLHRPPAEIRSASRCVVTRSPPSPWRSPGPRALDSIPTFRRNVPFVTFFLAVAGRGLARRVRPGGTRHATEPCADLVLLRVARDACVPARARPARGARPVRVRVPGPRSDHRGAARGARPHAASCRADTPTEGPARRQRESLPFAGRAHSGHGLDDGRAAHVHILQSGVAALSRSYTGAGTRPRLGGRSASRRSCAAARRVDDAHENRAAFAVKYRLRRADGEYQWLLDQAAPRFNDDGSFAGYVGVATPIDPPLGGSSVDA